MNLQDWIWRREERGEDLQLACLTYFPGWRRFRPPKKCLLNLRARIKQWYGWRKAGVDDLCGPLEVGTGREGKMQQESATELLWYWGVAFLVKRGRLRAEVILFSCWDWHSGSQRRLARSRTNKRTESLKEVWREVLCEPLTTDECTSCGQCMK